MAFNKSRKQRKKNRGRKLLKNLMEESVKKSWEIFTGYIYRKRTYIPDKKSKIRQRLNYKYRSF